MPPEGSDPTWSQVKAAYWRHHRAMKSQVARREAPPPDMAQFPDFWAWEYVHDLCGSGPSAALDRLINLAESAPDNEGLAYLGAGPVEDLVSGYRGLLIDDIEEGASRSPSFLHALQAMYPTEIPESVRVRMLPLLPASARENHIRQKQGLPPL
jgi:hypothetical protein